jgi:hypothetical protein
VGGVSLIEGGQEKPKRAGCTPVPTSEGYNGAGTYQAKYAAQGRPSSDFECHQFSHGDDERDDDDGSDNGVMLGSDVGNVCQGPGDKKANTAVDGSARIHPALLGPGDSNKTIARKMKIADATVEVHVKAILRKTRVRNRTQAAIWAMINGQLSMICLLWQCYGLRPLLPWASLKFCLGCGTSDRCIAGAQTPKREPCRVG